MKTIRIAKTSCTAIIIALGLSASAACSAEKNELVPNSLADAAVGEWALYKAENGYSQRFTVIERPGPGADATVTVQIDNLYEGEIVSTAFYSDTAGEVLTPPAAPEGGKVASVAKGVFPLAGKKIAATVVKVQSGEDGSGGTEWWVAPEAPVFGLLRQGEDGRTVLELLEFGKN